MPHLKRKTGVPDLVSLGQAYEVQQWCKVLGCTEAQLRKALAAVGPSTRKVREFLATQST